MPQILIMENVPEVCGSKNVKDFEKWQQRLSELGYTNYCEILNSKDYGIPQNRKRCFMVSILGEYNYTFPKKLLLRHKLEDMLETNVPEKYYLSKQHIEQIQNWNAQQKPLENCEKTSKAGIVPTLTARGAGEEHSVMVLIDEEILKIKNATEKGYLEAKAGDGVDISGRMEYHRGTVQKGVSQTITTMGGNDIGVVVKEEYEGTFNYAKSEAFAKGKRFKKNAELSETILASGNQAGVVVQLKRGYACEVKPESNDPNGVEVIGNYSKSEFGQTPIVSKKGLAPTVTENHGQVTAITEEESVYTETEKELFTPDGNIKRYLGGEKVDEFKEGQMATTTFPNGYGHGPRTHDESVALNTVDRPSVKKNLRIRKLTPCETMKLMGFENKDYQAMRDIDLSDSAIYHCSGDSIVTTCLISIIGNMLVGSLDQHIKIVENYVDKLKGENK